MRWASRKEKSRSTGAKQPAASVNPRRTAQRGKDGRWSLKSSVSKKGGAFSLDRLFLTDREVTSCAHRRKETRRAARLCTRVLTLSLHPALPRRRF